MVNKPLLNSGVRVTTRRCSGHRCAGAFLLPSPGCGISRPSHFSARPWVAQEQSFPLFCTKNKLAKPLGKRNCCFCWLWQFRGPLQCFGESGFQDPPSQLLPTVNHNTDGAFAWAFFYEMISRWGCRILSVAVTHSEILPAEPYLQKTLQNDWASIKLEKSGTGFNQNRRPWMTWHKSLTGCRWEGTPVNESVLFVVSQINP